MSSQRFPIWISDISELDLVYEGAHKVFQDLHGACLSLQRQIILLEHELRLLTDDPSMHEIMEDSKELRLVKERLKDKRGIKRQVENKLAAVHRLLQRISDPTVPQELIDEYNTRKRRESILEIMNNQEKYT